jgi:hypothetical protein
MEVRGTPGLGFELPDQPAMTVLALHAFDEHIQVSLAGLGGWKRRRVRKRHECKVARLRSPLINRVHDIEKLLA